MYIIVQELDFQFSTNIKMPSGNERGANIQWLIGGKTANGTIEGVLDMSNNELKFSKMIIRN